MKFILEPGDLAQHILFKPNVVNPEMYGIQYLINQVTRHEKEKVIIFDIGANWGQLAYLLQLI